MAELEELESKMSSELTPAQRERKEELRAKREFLYKHERQQRERRDAKDKKALQRVTDEEDEEELRDSIGGWRRFQRQGQLRTTVAPALKQNVGMVRLSEQAEKGADDDTKKDFLLHRKSWQDANRWRQGQEPPAVPHAAQPAAAVPAATAPIAAEAPAAPTKRPTGCWEAADAAGAAPCAADASPSPSPSITVVPCSAAWRATRDLGSGREYWWNTDTGQTSWERPAGVAAAPPAAGTTSAGSGGGLPQYRARPAPQYPAAAAPSSAPQYPAAAATSAAPQYPQQAPTRPAQQHPPPQYPAR